MQIANGLRKPIKKKAKPRKTGVEIKWEEPWLEKEDDTPISRSGGVFFNGKRLLRVEYSTKVHLGETGDFKGLKPIRGVSNIVDIKSFHPFPYTHPKVNKEKHEEIEQLKRQGIGTEVHRLLEEEILRQFPDTDALIAVIEPEHDPFFSGTSDEINRSINKAMRFYNSVGYKLHQKFVYWDKMEDDPTMKRLSYNPFGEKNTYYIMVKKLKSKKGEKYEWPA